VSSVLASLRLELQAASARATALGRAAAAEEARAAEAAARVSRLSAVHAAIVAAGIEARQVALDLAFEEAEAGGVPLYLLERIDERVEAGELTPEQAIQQVQEARAG
jgi:hypothetical protein